MATATGDDEIMQFEMAQASALSTTTKTRANQRPREIQADNDSSSGRFTNNHISADRSGMKSTPAVSPAGDPPNPSNDLAKPGNESTSLESKVKQLSSIGQAKDRAQITAATTMSIIQIALIKDIIDAGPIGNIYYYWSLSFIIMALILQVIAGFVALYITLLRYYYEEFKVDFVNDCIKPLCPWQCRRVQRSHTYDWLNKRSKLKKKHKSNIETEGTVEDSDYDPCTLGCCGVYKCTPTRFANFEYEVLDMYDDLQGVEIKARVQVANFDNRLKWLMDKETRLKNELQNYQAVDQTDEVNENDNLQKIKDDLKEIQEQRSALEENNICAEQLRAQKAILEHDVDTIEEKRVLKRATFWQNWLNMVLYSVFVLNAIIAGIGLANPQAKVIVVDPTGAPLNRTANG